MVFGNKKSAFEFLHTDNPVYVNAYGKLDADELFARACMLKDELSQFIESTDLHGQQGESEERVRIFDDITDRLLYIQKRYEQLTKKQLTYPEK